MKNNSKVFVRVAVICCAILMLSVVGLGFTLARYVKESNRAAENASVAKFGIEMKWSGDAVATSYDKADATATVRSSTEGKVIAPGTSGSITLTISGSSEVAFDLVINLTESYSNDWKTSATGTEYHPITLSAESSTSGFSTTITQDGKINVKSFAVGDSISGAVTITWSWAFEGNDAADTYIAGLTPAPTYSLTASAVATQID